jgi:hypothetical protein
VIRAFWFLVWCVLRLYACTRPKVVIRLDGEAYLTRWFLTCPWKPGDPTGPEGWYLHHIHRPDADRRLHNHPWHWASSRILRGGYSELYHAGDGRDKFRINYPGDGHYIFGYMFHRIHAVLPNTWTLFRAGPKHGKGWGFEP